MTELNLRILTAVVLLLGSIAWLFYLPAPWFNMVLGMIAVAGTVELLRMLKIEYISWYSAGAMLVWALLVANQGSWAILPVVLFILMFTWIFILIASTDAESLGTSFQKLAYGQWMMLWLILFVIVLMQLHATAQGIVFIAGACVGVWVTDIAAYFIGKAWGKTKLCPAVSPGKTIEGLIGGIVFGVMAAMLVWLMWMDMQIWVALLLAVFLVFAAVVGDLAESVLKRAVGVKDSGSMLPGHGGLLDRIDALLPAIPAAGLLWLALGSMS